MSKVSIAILGLSGSLGKPTIEAINSGKFDDKIQFPVKAFSRQDRESTDRIKYIKSELTEDTVDSISQELAGVDVIIEYLNPNPALLTIVEKVLEKVKPKLFIPSQFGIDILLARQYIPDILHMKYDHSENVRAIGGIKVVDIVTNWFAEDGLYLYEFVPHIGIDKETNTYLQIGDLDTTFPFTRVEDIGYIAIATATTPVEKLPDQIRVKSGDVSFREVIERYEKNHNVKLEVGTKLTPEEAMKQLKEKHEKTGFNWGDFFFYLQTLAVAVGLSYDSKDNELINPDESIWKWGVF
ncbi:uncharacterized protein J8A68_005853 [[Candida] subhashii]|uniref:NmrA-like domain-containing protein n=1 Tax=[Candida] subhashii TaxID=561895 RepID=A0A8J5UH18_9ASCO|nr:uncharacterized protein J8A68_005853 [[Candida] subhashii]KAG7660587.1 hypothetical protein J8A68_005853 [[Candida] subhashii]